MKKTTKTAAKKTQKPARRTVIIGNDKYGLYYGDVEDSDDQIIAKKAVRVFGCRHVFRWFGGTGGITSLAAWGLRAGADNRIGAPADALITGVVNVFDVTAEAKATFDATPASR